MSLNRIHFLCLGLLLLLGRKPCAFGFGPAADDTLPPEHLSADLHTYPNQDNFGRLEGGGKLLGQELDPPWLYTLVYFPHDSTRGLVLQNNLDAINVFLAAEIRRPDTARTFLKEHLLLFLEDTLASDDAFPITAGRVDGGYGSNPDSMPNSSSPRYRRLKQKLRRYARPEEPVVANNRWLVDINVLTSHGAVDRWLVKGSVRPLRINSFLCESKEPNGTFYPVPHVH